MRVRTAVAGAASVAALSGMFAPSAGAANPGAIIAEFGIPTPTGQPFGIAPGPDGSLWFTEARKDKIGRITPSGEVTEFPLPTTGAEPTGITTGPDGSLWFAESTKNKIGRVTTSGTVSEYEVPTHASGPFRIAAGPDGNVWFVEEHANKIGRISPTGVFAEFTIPSESSVPKGIAWGADGNMWFTETGANKIGRVSTTGVFAESPVLTPSSELEDIVPGPDGNLWFTEFGAKKIGRITPSGEVKEFELTSKIAPEWITSAPDGDLWFTAPEANTIGRITPSGEISEVELRTPSSQPTGIAVGSDGNLWVAESGTTGRIAHVGTGVAEALASAPVVTGGAQQGSAQTCTVAWTTWSSLQPQYNQFGFDGYGWLIDGVPVASGPSYTPTVANIGHRLTCSATVTYALPLLVSAVATSAPALVTTPPAPVIRGARETAKIWREGRALAIISRLHRSRRPPVGTTFSFGLNVQGSVTFSFTQARDGRRAGHRCVARTRRNAKRRKCTRTVTVGELTFAAHAGANRLVFDGRLSAATRLARGRYTVVIVATNTAGVASAPAALRFAIVR